MLAAARIVRGVKAARRIYERRGEKRVGRGMALGAGWKQPRTLLQDRKERKWKVLIL